MAEYFNSGLDFFGTNAANATMNLIIIAFILFSVLLNEDFLGISFLRW